MSGLTIAKLARAGGVGVETVRYYQRRGLLSQPDRPSSGGMGGGFRRYGTSDVERLRFIRSAKQAGFTLEEIAELLALDGGDDRDRARELAERRIAAIDAEIGHLQSARDALAKLAQHCALGPPGPCPILDAFSAAGRAGQPS